MNADEPWLSIVIPVRNEAANLWFTLHGLAFQGLSGVEIVVADNGGVGSKDVEQVTRRFGPPARYVLADATASVNHPRNAGAAAARGSWLLFLDAHVLLSPAALALLRQRIDQGAYPDRALVHLPLLREDRHVAFGHYRLTLEEDFWGRWGPFVRQTEVPYRIAATGNYALLTRKVDFDAVRGFNPGFVGYGGDEVYFQLKYWRLGGAVWLEPLVRAAHYGGPRGYIQRPAEVLRNIALGARVVVGPELVPRFGDALLSTYAASAADGERATLARALAAGVTAAEESGEAAWLEGTAALSFDEVRKRWREEGVPID